MCRVLFVCFNFCVKFSFLRGKTGFALLTVSCITGTGCGGGDKCERLQCQSRIRGLEQTSPSNFLQKY